MPSSSTRTTDRVWSSQEEGTVIFEFETPDKLKAALLAVLAREFEAGILGRHDVSPRTESTLPAAARKVAAAPLFQDALYPTLLS
ncbi:MAG: hypothetical protein FJW26_08775 [Acidimicrobiia bacterium]|nr:hypothetical protein [Acidimicrobiia bacterium]